MKTKHLDQKSPMQLDSSLVCFGKRRLLKFSFMRMLCGARSLPAKLCRVTMVQAAESRKRSNLASRRGAQ